MRLSNVKPEMPDQIELYGDRVPTDCQLADEHGNQVDRVLAVRFTLDTRLKEVHFEVDYVPEAWMKRPAITWETPPPDATGESQGLYHKTERYRVTEPFIIRGFRV